MQKLTGLFFAMYFSFPPLMPATAGYFSPCLHSKPRSMIRTRTTSTVFLMCDDIAATLRGLKSKGVKVSDVSEQRWGKLATLALPGGGKIGLYEPNHPTPLKL